MLAGCHRQPAISGEAYREAVVAFYTGLAALQTSQEVLARQQLERVISLAPNEPSAWANAGLLLLRQQDLDGASERLKKAAELAPGHPAPRFFYDLALVRSGGGDAALKDLVALMRENPGASWRPMSEPGSWPLHSTVSGRAAPRVKRLPAGI